MHSPDTTQQPRAARFGRRSKWQLGLIAGVAAVTLSPVAALAVGNGTMQQTDGDQVGEPPLLGEYGNYVTTTVPDRSLDVSAFSPSCQIDVPIVSYTIKTNGFTPSPPNATLVIRSKDGTVVGTKNLTSLSGSFIWPGASADANGNGTDWPGWKRADDGVSWIPDASDAGLRAGLVIDVSVAVGAATPLAQPEGFAPGGLVAQAAGDVITATATVTYPASTSPCANPPGQALDVSGFSPVCIADAPFISYAITPINFASTGPATLTFSDRNGGFVSEQVVNSLSGRVIFPGASVDANGTATDWPGWKIADDGVSWVPDPSDAFLREGLTVKVQVGSNTATTTVGYVSSDAPCANPPGDSAPTTTICTDGPNGDCTAPTTTVCTPGQNNDGNPADDCTPPACVPGQNNDSNPADDCTPPACVPGQNNDSNPADDCALPRTGGSPNSTLIIAAIALLGGLVFLGAARRRRQPGDTPDSG